MSKLPFEQQRLSPDPTDVKDWIAQGRAVPGRELLRTVEKSIGLRLPPAVRELFGAFSAPEIKHLGRRRKTPGKDDFSMEEVDERYAVLLQQFQHEDAQSSSDDDGPPSQRAYSQIATEIDLGNIGWEALRNKHSKWRNGHFHSLETCVDSKDFEAEIERKFSTPKRS